MEEYKKGDNVKFIRNSWSDLVYSGEIVKIEERKFLWLKYTIYHIIAGYRHYEVTENIILTKSD